MDVLWERKTTFTTPDCTEVQCYGYKRRSYENLLELALTYYPETTEKELLKTLDSLEESSITHSQKVCANYCEDVGGVVFSRINPDKTWYNKRNRLLTSKNYYDYKYSKKEILNKSRDGRKTMKDLRKILNSK